MTERVGLFGWPLGHSISPPMQNAAFQALGLDWQYELFACPPENFEVEVARLIAAGCRGFNVTIPHKQEAFHLSQVSEISRAAATIGAVNTLIVKPDGTLKADNTDWRGFTADLQAHGVTIAPDQPCLILGTGGAARAVVFALRQMGVKTIMLATPIENESLAGKLMQEPKLIMLDEIKHESYEVVIACTPIGMSPHVDASPWPEDTPIPPGIVLYDVIYNPPVTKLMRQFQEAGGQAFNGLGMLIRQGAASFELWTGQAPPVEVMMDAAKAALYSHSE
ncbi:MAG: shikimate dehydrogenase [Anaerolineae bacterium]|nr:shikimate dehydrogenase [Anaerolineae bacterium]